MHDQTRLPSHRLAMYLRIESVPPNQCIRHHAMVCLSYSCTVDIEHRYLGQIGTVDGRALCAHRETVTFCDLSRFATGGIGVFPGSSSLIVDIHQQSTDQVPSLWFIRDRLRGEICIIV